MADPSTGLFFDDKVFIDMACLPIRRWPACYVLTFPVQTNTRLLHINSFRETVAFALPQCAAVGQGCAWALPRLPSSAQRCPGFFLGPDSAGSALAREFASVGTASSPAPSREIFPKSGKSEGCRTVAIQHNPKATQVWPQMNITRNGVPREAENDANGKETRTRAGLAGGLTRATGCVLRGAPLSVGRALPPSEAFRRALGRGSAALAWSAIPLLARKKP